MSAQPPILETARLILRPPCLDDHADVHALWSDPDVVRHITGTPLSVEDSWGRLMRSVGHWALQGFGHWIVRTRDGGFVGEVGFARLKRGIAPWFDAAPEAGWVLATAAQGRGYAVEAVDASLAWSATRWPGGETVCIIAPDNAASLQLAARFGYRRDGEVRYRGQPTVVLRRAA
jgi:RimJ/RimL family protein N-acetyltransferase